MADIGKYKAHRKMMQDPERKKAYIDAMKRKRKETASNQTITKPSRSMVMDTTTYPLGQDPQFRKRGKPTLQNRKRKLPPKEDNIGQFSKGGYCRGAGAAIKGTKFEGVF